MKWATKLVVEVVPGISVDLAGHGAEDAAVCGAAGLSATASGEAAQAGAVDGCHRRHSGRGQDATGQAATHRQADSRPAQRRAWVHGRLPHRAPVCARRATAQPGEVRGAAACGRGGAGGLRRSVVGHCRSGTEGALPGGGPAALGRLLRHRI